jgi:hypothetical protein
LRTVEAVRKAAAAVAEEEEELAVASVAGSSIPVRASKIDYAGAYKLSRSYLTKLSLAAIALIIAVATIGEVTRRENQKVFMPGGVSSAHARARDAKGNSIAEDCAACHDPWKSVQDTRCMNCHTRVVHANNEKDTPPCMTCHTEHRGLPKLALINDATCASCHTNLPAHTNDAVPAARAGRYAQAALRSITEFGKDHPDLVYPPDLNNLRFNHKLHLRAGGIFNATGRREELTCDGCHKLVVTRGKADPVRLEFEQHCQRCHKLTFDARFPESEIPHGGDPQLAYGYIATTYAGNRDIIGKSPEEVRRLLTRRAVVGLDERAVINAAQVLKVKCGKCHELKRSRERFVVDPPIIRTNWMDGSKFTHTAHSGLNCETCHKGLRESAQTTELHMPSQADCTSCHARGSTAASSCVTCHEYHVRSRPILAGAVAAPLAGNSGGNGEERRMLDTILLIIIVVLVLVVLIPVSLALYQRLKPKADDRPAAPAAPKPAPPPMTAAPPAAAPRAQAPAAPARQAPAASPPPAPMSPPGADSTRIASSAELSGAKPAGGSTEFVEWYGMILCTSGALEGQRFVVEPEGIYIGRDASLAQVVINDSRISKRHVRVVPRSGKVWAVDEGSTNGTFLGSAPTQRITEVQLKRGDTLVLADNAATFLYQI